jgi:ABC-2 type transport system ATP-binding protein
MEALLMAIPVDVSSVKKAYGSLNAVDGVSFSVEKGEIFAILGPNGAGKTTLIEILEGLRKRDKGTVKILGLDPWEKSSMLHKRVGVMPQDFTFFEKATPREAVKYYADLFGIGINPDEILKEVMLEDSAKTLFENLSGGQKQKVGVALSLVNSPELLFLDEPTTGLDPTARRAVWDVIRSLKDKGKTIILTTHYLEEAEQLADRVVIMNRGRILAMGTPDEIVASHGSGETLQVHGTEELASYIKAKTKLKVGYNGKGLITIAINQKHDAFVAITAIEQSGLDWSDLRTHQDSLEDAFVKLVQGTINAQGEITTANGGNGHAEHSRRS